MAHNTPFLEYELRMNYSGTKKMCDYLGIKSTYELPERIKTLTNEDLETIIAISIKAKHPLITIEKLREEGGLFDQFMSPDGSNGPGELGMLALQVLFDSGILSQVPEPEQAGDKGEETSLQ